MSTSPADPTGRADLVQADYPPTASVTDVRIKAERPAGHDYAEWPCPVGNPPKWIPPPNIPRR